MLIKQFAKMDSTSIKIHQKIGYPIGPQSQKLGYPIDPWHPKLGYSIAPADQNKGTLSAQVIFGPRDVLGDVLILSQETLVVVVGQSWGVLETR